MVRSSQGGLRGNPEILPTPKYQIWKADLELSEEPVPTESLAESAQPSDRSTRAPIPLQQAIDTGALIDVTPTAKQLGLSFSVTVTKLLWDTGIAPTNTLTEEERSARLRDADGAQASPDGAADHGAFDRFSGIVGVSPRRNPPAGSAVCLSATGRAASGDGNVAASH